MLGSSNARIRQILTIVCLCIVFLLSLIVMGLVGVNGNVTFQTFEKGCLLYMTVTDNVVTYNNGFCLFPIVGSAVIAFVSLLFLIYWIMIVHRKDEFAPRSMSGVFLAFSGLCGLLSFAICGEIGLGLNKGCQILGDQSRNCHSKKNFNALYGAEISAGLMGGFWLLAMALELFQLRGRPHLWGISSVDQFATTSVVPNTRHSQVSNSDLYNKGNVHGKSPVATTTTTQVQKEEYVQPEMTSYPAHGSHYQQPYQTQHEQQQQHYQQQPYQQQHYQTQNQDFQQPYHPPPPVS